MELQNETPQQETQAISKEDVRRAASLMIEAEYTVEETIQSFVKRGYSEEDATMIVAYASQAAKTAVKKNKGNGVANLVIGIVLLVLGIALTASGIGRIFYGAIIVGIVKIIQGAIAMNGND